MSLEHSERDSDEALGPKSECRVPLWRRIATAVGVIGATVALHEAAHAVAAARGGGRVKEIGVGFGPSVLRLRVRSTPVVVRAFPLGGYAALDIEQIPPRERIGMLLAGPLANIAVGLPLLFGFRRHDGVMLEAEHRVGVTGFIGTLSALSRAAEQGVGAVGRLAGAINVGLGMMNLMPVYPLDGGHVAMTIMESRGVPRQARAAFARLTAALFFLLVQNAMLGDLRRLTANTRTGGHGNRRTGV